MPALRAIYSFEVPPAEVISVISQTIREPPRAVNHIADVLGRVPFSRIKGPMPDFACSEGNFSLVEILAAAHAADEAGREKVQTLSIR
jgi:hypothetical protein